MKDAADRRTDGPSGGSDAEGPVDEARRTVDDVRREAVSQAKKTGEQVRDRAREEAKSTLESGTSRLAAQVGSVSKALRSGGESFRDDGQEELAHQTDRLADRVASVRDLIDDYGADGAYEEIRHLVSNRPFLLVGGAAVIGVAAATLLARRRSGRSRYGR